MSRTEAFTYRHGELYAEDVSLSALAAAHGTPLYVYSRSKMERTWQAFSEAVKGRDVLLCYAMKANSNLAVLDLFARLGAGFDIVSGGELQRVLAAGGDPTKVVFSGVGKSAADIRLALEHEVLCFNVESSAELDRLSAIASEMGKTARVSMRVNPDVDAGTHPYISTGLSENKFGIAREDALAVYAKAASLPGLEVTGIDCHIGSQITDSSPFLDALERVLALVDELSAAGIPIHHLDLGGGLGIQYTDEVPPTPRELLDALFARIDRWRGSRSIKVLFEYGRALVGNAGILLTQVEYLKPGAAKNFAIVDAAMNDLIRPTLYEAWHDIIPVVPRAGAAMEWDIVGPVCESGDWLGRQRMLNLQAGDLLAILSAGAYGMVQASNYNSRSRAAEVLVHGDAAWLVRPRETVSELFASERRLPD